MLRYVLLGLMLPCAALAQTPDKQTLRDHRSAIARSLHNREAVVSLDTLFYIGKPYCLLKVIDKGFGNKDYRASSLTGKEFAFITTQNISNGVYISGTGNRMGYWNYGNANGMSNTDVRMGQTYESYYTFFFIPYNERAEISKTFGAKIPSLIAQYDMFNTDSLNRDRVESFVHAYGTAFSEKKKRQQEKQTGNVIHDTLDELGLTNHPTDNAAPTANNAAPAPTASNAPVFQLLNRKVYRDSRQVAYYEEKSGMTNGHAYRKIIVMMPDATKVAEATSDGADNHNWSVQTLQDNTEHPVQSEAGNDAKDIVAFLLTFHYL